MSRITALDPASLHMGICTMDRINDEFTVIESGVLGLERHEDEKFGDFKHRLIRHWIKNAHKIWKHNPDSIYSETMPAQSSGSFGGVQVQLGKTALVVCQVMNYIGPNIEWIEIQSSSWKKLVHGMASKPPKTKGGKRQKISKVDTRNKVQEMFPQYRDRVWEKDLMADECDAVAITLAALGYRA